MTRMTRMTRTKRRLARRPSRLTTPVGASRSLGVAVHRPPITTAEPMPGFPAERAHSAAGGTYALQEALQEALTSAADGATAAISSRGLLNILLPAESPKSQINLRSLQNPQTTQVKMDSVSEPVAKRQRQETRPCAARS